MIRNRSSVNLTAGLFLQPYVVAQLTGALVEQIVDGSDVTASEFAVTSWLDARGSATPSELAYDLGLAPTTLSAMIGRLVRKKQVRRVRHPADGRSYVLELTARGRATNARNGERFGGALCALRSQLDADPEKILDALRRLEAALRRTLTEA